MTKRVSCLWRIALPLTGSWCSESMVKALVEFLLVLRDLLIRRDLNDLMRKLRLSCHDCRAPDTGKILTCPQPARDLHHLLLSHPEHQKISSRIDENGASYAVFPPVIVSKTAEACLNPSQHDARILESLPNPIGVNSGRPVRAKPCPAAGRIIISGASSLIGRVVGDHGVEVPGSNAKKETRLAKLFKVVGGAPIGLSDDTRP